MKKLIIIIFTLFVSQLVNAESILDFEGNIKDIKDKFDEHYKCGHLKNKSQKYEIAFKKINGRMYAFNIIEDYVFVTSNVKIYNSKLSDDRNVDSYIFVQPTNHGLAGGIFQKNLFNLHPLE